MDAGAFSLEKLLHILNLAASLLWMEGAMWFQPELQLDPKYQTYNACNLFVIGIALFLATTANHIYGARKQGAPFILQLLLFCFEGSLSLFLFGILGFYPDLNWGQDAITLILVATFLLMLVTIVLMILTLSACKQAAVSKCPCIPLFCQLVGLALFHSGAWTFGQVLKGNIALIYSACYQFQAGTFFFPLFVLCSVLFPAPSAPSSREKTNSDVLQV